MKIIIAAGGTGGHIYPGIAIADELKERNPDADILFVGSKDGMEKQLINQAGYDIKLIKSRALLRTLSYKAISAPFVTALGIFQAFFLLLRFSPQALISTGGYASLPVVLAAVLLRIPIYIHEQNVFPGVVNRFCKRFAKKVFLTFAESNKYLSGEVVGNPVRKQIITADKSRSRHALNLSKNSKIILIMGGSQGAQKINEAVVASISKLPKDIEVLHVVGNRDFSWVNQRVQGKNIANYHAMPYLHNNIADALAAADLVISRAGATATAEFLVRNLPMILIPYPYAANDHQRENARVICKNDAAIMVENKDFTAEKFIDLISDPDFNYARMVSAAKKLAKPLAAKRIVDYVVN